jgi:hypothetical protein
VTELKAHGDDHTGHEIALTDPITGLRRRIELYMIFSASTLTKNPDRTGLRFAAHLHVLLGIDTHKKP